MVSGQVIKHYEIVEIISTRERGVTGLCVNKSLGTEWMIKFLPQGLETLEVDFLLEIDHRRVPKLVDVIKSDSGTYYVMSLIKGISLNEYFSYHNASYKELLSIMVDLTDVLVHIHGLCIVHGDIKMENIIIDDHIGACLVDYGSAFRDQDSKAFTLDYVAPERLLDSFLPDERSDIYSLGILYEKMLDKIKVYKRTGGLLYQAKLRKIIKKCQQVNPANRYQGVTDLRNDLIKLT